MFKFLEYDVKNIEVYSISYTGFIKEDNPSVLMKGRSNKMSLEQILRKYLGFKGKVGDGEWGMLTLKLMLLIQDVGDSLGIDAEEMLDSISERFDNEIISAR